MLWDAFNPRSQTGAFNEALSSIDIALWDIKGKQLGEPVWRLLGGDRNPVECYVTFGLHEYTEAELVELAADLVDEGHTRLKMHAYDEEDELDVVRSAERIGAVREAIGEDAHLMVDANHKYSVAQALDLCRRVEEYNLTWFEEPVRGNDAEHLRELRNRTQSPIVAGQHEGNRFRHRALIENGAIDICQPNVAHVGGYTEGKLVAALAASFNLDIANGGAYPHHNAHLQAGVPNGTWVEYHREHWAAGDRIYEDPYTPDGNQVELPETPGLGLVPDLDAIDEFETESPSPPSRSFRTGSREQITRN
jgi:L-alanine-DL-glutamate epimerase-like enolase superfamily enzyme